MNESNNKKLSKRDLNNLTVKYLNTVNTNYELTLPNKWLKWYLAPLSILIITTFFYLFLLSQKLNIILIIIMTVTYIPLSLITIVIMCIRFFLFDFGNLKSFIFKFFKDNYLIANFYTSSKKLISKVVFLNREGTFFIYQNGLYLVNPECIWLDNDKNPNSFYKLNQPNPLKFNFNYNVKKFHKALNDSIEKGIFFPPLDDEGEEIIIGYDSVSIKKFNDEKVLKDFHQDPEQNKIIMMLIGGMVILGVIFVAIIFGILIFG